MGDEGRGTAEKGKHVVKYSEQNGSLWPRDMPTAPEQWACLDCDVFGLSWRLAGMGQCEWLCDALQRRHGVLNGCWVFRLANVIVLLPCYFPLDNFPLSLILQRII